MRTLIFIFLLSTLSLGPAQALEVIVDNDGGAPAYTETGVWNSSGSTGYNSGTYRYATVGGGHAASWKAGLGAGDAEVSVIYRSGGNRASSAKYVVHAADGDHTVNIDQQQNDLSWVNLGTFPMKNGDNSVTLDAAGSSGGAVVIADAVRFVSASVTPTPTPTPTPLVGEWRAFWVDAWHDGIMNASQVSTMISTAVNNNYNVVVIQIRRRGDAFYFPTSPNIEPRNSSIAADFDPLQETIDQAHLAGLEVHAWLPTFLISSTSTPTNPNHVYNLHPEYLMENDIGEKNISEGYYLDPGNPDANKWNYNVVMDLVAHYNIDGIHFDYIRYPQQNSGYNPTAIARYNAEFDLTGKPAYTDPQFSAWKRRQITDWLRATYTDIIALKPNMKVTASVFASRSDAYSYRFQDWAKWLQDNHLDSLCPMNYTTSDSTFNSRTDDIVANKFQRQVYMGNGAYMVSKEQTVTQLSYARSKGCEGLLHYSYQSTNSTGDSNATFYSYIKANLFTTAKTVPIMPWKTSPTGGYIRGKITDAPTSDPVYNATITIAGLGRNIRSDGEGKYAITYFEPGTYTVVCEASGYSLKQQHGVVITAGEVTTVDFSMGETPPTPTPTPTSTPTPTPTPTNVPPQITLLTPSSEKEWAWDIYTITWTDSDPDNNALISLYYDEDSSGADGSLIIGGLSEDSGTNQYDWDTGSIEEGIYWIYAVIDDGTNSPVVSYSPGSVIISRITEQAIRNHILGIEPIPPERLLFADFNKDGVLDIADLIALINR